MPTASDFPISTGVTGFEYDLIDEGTNNARFVPGSTVPVEPLDLRSGRCRVTTSTDWVELSDPYTLSEIGESLDFTDLGDHQLKNIVQPVRVYRTEPQQNRGYFAFNETPNKPSIAGLPFIGHAPATAATLRTCNSPPTTSAS